MTKMRQVIIFCITKEGFVFFGKSQNTSELFMLKF